MVLEKVDGVVVGVTLRNSSTFGHCVSGAGSVDSPLIFRDVLNLYGEVGCEKKLLLETGR